MIAVHSWAVQYPQPGNKKTETYDFGSRHLKFLILSAPLRQARECQGCSFPSVHADGGACVAAVGCRTSHWFWKSPGLNF